jgi:hypothetical protein
VSPARRRALSILTASATSLLAVSSAMADPRPFTFVTDTYSVGQGHAEYEQFVTWEHRKETDKGYDRFRFRHELEYGVTDNFDIAVYFINWNYEDSDARSGTRYESSAVEGIFYISNPVTDFMGSGLYMEVGVGEEGKLFFEPKLLLQKNIDQWVFAYNLVAETEIEGLGEDRDTEVTGELKHAFGVSYALGRQWRLGGELKVESEYEDWSEHEETTVYAGPNVHYSSGGPWWLTVTPLVQLSDEDGAPEFETRMIFGWEF